MDLLANLTEENCTQAAIDDFPKDLFTQEQRQAGAVVLHIVASLYLFAALAVVCDKYFVPAVDMMCQALNMSNDVAGATFMAAATSAPELFVNVIGTFITEGDIGVGTIVGSAVFNILAVGACCGIGAGKVVPLDWWPLTRDCVAYGITVAILICIIHDERVEWYEALILVSLYLFYIAVMYFDKKIQKWARALLKLTDGPNQRSLESNSVHSSLEEALEARIPLQGENKIPRGEHQQHNGNIKWSENIADTKNQQNKANLTTVNVIPANQILTAIGNEKSRKGKELNASSKKDKQDDKNEAENNVDGNNKLQITNYESIIKGSVIPDVNYIDDDENANAETEHSTKQEVNCLDKSENMNKLKSDPSVQQAVIYSDDIVKFNTNKDDPQADEDEDDDSYHHSLWEWPSGRGWFIQTRWVVTWPIYLIFICSIPDCEKKRFKSWYSVTFLMCIIWIGSLSYVVAWMITILGHTLKIPDSVMGITFLAAGTSVPEAVSSVIVAKKGHGSMGISNSIGSNTFDILLCLGLPWLIKAAFLPTDPGHHWVAINSSGLEYSAISLLSTLFMLYITFYFNKFMLDKKVGRACLCMYVVFLVLATLIELNVFFRVNLPTCGR